MRDLRGPIQGLKVNLGDFLERNRADGVFFVQVGGPGSVPALRDLDVPELHLDLLPGELTDEQKETLTTLGYRPDGEHWGHAGGWRLVFPDHGTNWRASQKALADLLNADDDAAQEYRTRYEARGRTAADTALAQAALKHHARTVGFTPAQFIASTLAPLEVPWMFAAGLALDLHAGRITRPHDDVDIIFPREQQMELRQLLHAHGWRTDAAMNGTYQAWTAPLEPPHFQVHARHPDLPGVIMADFMFTDLSHDTWHYRRDPDITLPLSEARQHAKNGFPYLAPQATLLFKSGSGGQPRPKDEQDFGRARPTLTPTEKHWLAQNTKKANDKHPWVERLKE